jgi:hypothetical protein
MPPPVPQWASSPHDGTVAFARPGYPWAMSDYLQNDPDRAGGLIADAQGEFVLDDPAGAFDPRTFREGSEPSPEQPADPSMDEPVDTPPVNDERMSGPREEIDKTR